VLRMTTLGPSMVQAAVADVSTCPALTIRRLRPLPVRSCSSASSKVTPKSSSLPSGWGQRYPLGLQMPGAPPPHVHCLAGSLYWFVGVCVAGLGVGCDARGQGEARGGQTHAAQCACSWCGGGVEGPEQMQGCRAAAQASHQLEGTRGNTDVAKHGHIMCSVESKSSTGVLGRVEELAIGLERGFCGSKDT
jgi:hypothetical protein